MSKRSRGRDKPARRAPGGYTALPDEVLDCEAFADLSHKARSLLLCVMAQFNRFNNADLAITLKGMRRFGWRSDKQMRQAIAELESHGFLIRTQQGGRNRPNLFALSFYNLQPCHGDKMRHVATPVAPRRYLEWSGPAETPSGDIQPETARLLADGEIPAWVMTAREGTTNA